MDVAAEALRHSSRPGALLSLDSIKWTIAAVIVATLVIIALNRFRVVWNMRHVPSSPGGYIPLLGDLPSIVSKDLTYFLDSQYRRFPKAFTAWMGSTPIVVITNLELARRLLMRYVDRPEVNRLAVRKPLDALVFTSNQVFINGDPWRVQRRASEGVVLHAKALSALVPFVSQVTARLVTHLDRYASSGIPLDMQEALWMMTIDAVGWAAFGVDLHASESLDQSPATATGATVSPGSYNGYEDRFWEKYPVGSPGFGRGLVASSKMSLIDLDPGQGSSYTPMIVLLPELKPFWMWLANKFPDAKYVESAKGHEGIREGCKKIIEVWKKQQAAGKTDDGQVSSTGLLANVLSGQDFTEGKLKDHELLGLVIGTVIAGYETTGTTVAMALYYLSVNPEAQARAQKEVDEVLQGRDPVLEDLEQLPYINGVFQESLRLTPPGASAIRRVNDDPLDAGDGIKIPKGVGVLIPTFSYMRDPAIWPRALEFLPERHIQPGNEELAPSTWNAFMPFGHGSRLCVGYKFATMESRMALARMMQRFTFETVPGEPAPKLRTSLTFKPPRVLLRIGHRPSKNVD